MAFAHPLDLLLIAENTQDLPPLESLLEIRRSTAKIATSASSSLLSNVEDADKAEDLQGPSALLIVSHTRKRSMEKHTDLAATAPKKKMSSVRSTSSAPLPPRTEQSAVSRPTEPITGQTYELLILAAMSVRLIFFLKLLINCHDFIVITHGIMSHN